MMINEMPDKGKTETIGFKCTSLEKAQMAYLVHKAQVFGRNATMTTPYRTFTQKTIDENRHLLPENLR